MTEPDPLAVYVSVDMEGVAGIAHPRQVQRGADDYPAARRLMTQEASAAVAGAFAAGATRVVVNDGHGDNANILPEELDPRAELMMGAPKRSGGMVDGVQEGFAACLLIGYHARAGTLGAALDHTVSSASFADVRVNGQSWSEADLNCAIAGTFGVPVVMLSGDQAACREVRERHPQISVVQTKIGLGHNVIQTLSPAVARSLIREAAEHAVTNRARVAATRTQGPFTVEVEMLTSAVADRCSVMPGSQRLTARTVAYECQTPITVRNLLTCFAMLGAAR